MELELNYKYAGIDWQVTVDVNDDWELEQIFKVEAYDNKAKKYQVINCDLVEFEHAMQDQLQDALEEEKTAAYEFAMDMKFEQAREAKRGN